MRICFIMAAVVALASGCFGRDSRPADRNPRQSDSRGPDRAHLRQDSLTVKAGDAVKAGTPIAKLGNTGPSEGPHLHFGLLDKPDPIAGRSLPFVFDSFTLDGAVDFDISKGDQLVIRPDARQVRSAYPLYGGILNFP